MKTIKESITESIIGRRGSDPRNTEAVLQDHDIIMMTERKNPNKKYLYRLLTNINEINMAATYADKTPCRPPALYRLRLGGIIFIPINDFNPRTGFFDNSNGMMITKIYRSAFYFPYRNLLELNKQCNANFLEKEIQAGICKLIWEL